MNSVYAAKSNTGLETLAAGTWGRNSQIRLTAQVLEIRRFSGNYPVRASNNAFPSHTLAVNVL